MDGAGVNGFGLATDPPRVTRVSLLERLGIAVPVIGAGMGGGLSTASLTVAIGRAGGMGQIGFASPAEMRRQMAAHREATDAGPLVVNLLLPFAQTGALGGASSPVLSRAPLVLVQQAVRFQRPWMPLLMPVAPTAAHPSSLVDSAPLYAGQCISRINDVRRTSDIVADLAGH